MLAVVVHDLFVNTPFRQYLETKLNLTYYFLIRVYFQEVGLPYTRYFVSALPTVSFPSTLCCGSSFPLAVTVLVVIVGFPVFGPPSGKCSL